ncbi:MAG: hypothetical protein KGL39_24275 [Patescibacteria group bacterium]|nr:hypothetical protein [Patescibacteria group bacterium]
MMSRLLILLAVFTLMGAVVGGGLGAGLAKVHAAPPKVVLTDAQQKYVDQSLKECQSQLGVACNFNAVTGEFTTNSKTLVIVYTVKVESPSGQIMAIVDAQFPASGAPTYDVVDMLPN